MIHDHYMWGAEYLILGLVYVLIGYLILRTLKLNFTHFHHQHKNKLILVTMGLSGSLILKGLFNILKDWSTAFTNLILKDVALTNLIVFIVCDTFPIFFQLSTLIFGYIRMKSENDQIKGSGGNIYTSDVSSTNSLIYRDSSGRSPSYFDPHP